MASFHELASGDVGWYRRLEYADRVGTVATANAIVSLRSAGADVPRRYDVVRTLVSRQRDDGGWAFITNVSEVSVVDATAAVISALQEWQSVLEFRDLRLSSVLERAMDWLESASLPDGGWGLIAEATYRNYSSALAVQALCTGGRRASQTVQKALRRFITEADPVAGGWLNSNRQVSVPVTAEVIRALEGASSQNIRYAPQISKAANWLLAIAQSTEFWKATSATANLEEIEVFVGGRRTRIEYGYTPRPLAIHAIAVTGEATRPEVSTATQMLIDDLRSDRWAALGHNALPTSWMLLDVSLALVAFRGLISRRTLGVSTKTRDISNAADGDPRRATSNVVLALHGIRTRGKWQKELTPILNSAGFTVAPLDYGFFGAVRLIFPWSREKKVDWFLQKFTEESNRLHFERPSIVAHSFGTYILAKALEKYGELAVDRVIFCASIISADFPWTRLASRGQLRGVLNQFGAKDIWPKIAHRVISDGGDSGTGGFKNDAPALLVQQSKPLFGHSDYFYDLNYQQNWIPFLCGEQLAAPADEAPRRKSPIKSWAIRVLFLSLVIGIAFYIYRRYLSQ